MKKVIILVALVACAAGAFAEASKKSVEELMKIMRMEEQYTQTANAMLDMQSKSMGGGNSAMIKVIKEFNEEYLSWKGMKTDIVNVYVETFSDGEIKELCKFYKTKIGQKLLDKQPELQQKLMQLTAARSQKYMPQLQQKIMKAMQPQTK